MMKALIRYIFLKWMLNILKICMICIVIYLFLPERMKINKYNKLVCNLYDKKDYVVHIRILKKALNNALILKKVHRVIKFNQIAWLKSYINMNTELRAKAKRLWKM